MNAKKVQAIIAYYDARQGKDLLEDPDHEVLPDPTAWVEVPIELLPRVRKLVSQHRKSA
jgi:hypothetical protein